MNEWDLEGAVLDGALIGLVVCYLLMIGALVYYTWLY